MLSVSDTAKSRSHFFRRTRPAALRTVNLFQVGAAADTVEQAFIPIYAERRGYDGDKMTPLYRELELMELGKKEKCLIFVGMKRTASWLAQELCKKGKYGATEIHGRNLWKSSRWCVAVVVCSGTTSESPRESAAPIRSGSGPWLVDSSINLRKIGNFDKSSKKPPGMSNTREREMLWRFFFTS